MSIRNNRRTLLANNSVNLTLQQVRSVARSLLMRGHFNGGYLLLEVDRTDGRTISTVITQERFQEVIDRIDLILDDNFDIELESDVIRYLLSSPLHEFTRVTYHKVKGRRRGGFFPYYNNTNIDLSRFGIYTKKQTKENKNEHCLVVAMKISKLFKEEEIKYITADLVVDYATSKTITKIAKDLKCQIWVKKIFPEKKKYYDFYKHNKKQETKRILKLGIIGKHYLYMDNVGVKLSELKKGKIQCSSKSNFISIHNFINKVFRLEKSIFKKIFHKIIYDELAVNSLHRQKFQEIENLDYQQSEECYKTNEETKLKNNPHRKLYFDFESDPTARPHKPYMVVVGEHKRDNTYEYNLKDDGEDFVKLFFNFLVYYASKKKVRTLRLYAHNLAYDFQFLRTFGFILTHIGSMSNVYMSKIIYHGVTIILIDTYKMISQALHKFGSMFGLDIEKEVLPYELFSGEYLHKDKMPMSVVEEYYKNKKEEHNRLDISQLKKNIEKLNLYTPDKKSFYHYKYSSYYCNRDVLVMKKGYIKFSQDVKKITGLDMFDYLTISSLSKNHFIHQGVLDGCLAIRGIPRKFIDKSKIGGRVMIANNQKCIVNMNIADLDANGLYLSSMNEMGDKGGTLMGIPKLLETTNYNIIKKYDGYFIQIKITKVGKKYPFPLYCFVRGGKNDWTNELEDKVIVVNRFQLEGLIEFSKIEFEVIRGYYYDDGRNPKIKEVTQKLHNDRCVYKQPDNYNLIEKTYKVIGNGFYGKLIEKPHNTDTKLYNSKSKYKAAFRMNYFKVERGIENDIDKFYQLDLIKETDKHYNNVHIGSEILSLSKTIMNRVLCLCYDNNIEVYYSDTDSMPMNYDKLKLLEILYKEKYNTDLLHPTELGKFENDFEGESEEPVYAVRGIYLAKKCYWNKVKLVQKGKVIYKDHIRAKGYPREAIVNFCKVNKMTVEEFYELLSYGEKFEINISDITDKVRFEVRNGGYYTTSNIKKKLHFPGDLLIIDKDGNKKLLNQEEMKEIRIKLWKKIDYKKL